MIQKRQRTEKSKYKHESTGDYCTCAAYVAEIMCRKNAENKNSGSLPFKFWNKKPWDWTFKRQLFVARQLLKDFSEEAVVKAINSEDFRGIFSLNHPKVRGIVSKFQSLVDRTKDSVQVLDVSEDPKTRSAAYGNKKKIKSLRNLSDGEK